jgi:hypothetical protein
VRLAIDDSRFEGNGRDGIHVGGLTRTAITRTVVSGNGAMGLVISSGRANVTSVTAANNGDHGFAVSEGGELTVESSVASAHEDAGLFVGTNSTARVSTSAFTGNGIGMLSSGALQSRGNNMVSGNTTDTFGTITPLAGR